MGNPVLLCERDGVSSGQCLLEGFTYVLVWQMRPSYMMWEAHISGLSAQISKCLVTSKPVQAGCEPHPDTFGCKGQTHAIFCTELTYTSGVSGLDPSFEGRLGALESRGNWQALSIGQGLCRAKGFSPPGHANSCALRPCHSGSEALFCSCIAMVSVLNQSPWGAGIGAG